MAALIKAISKYRPRIILGKPATAPRFMEMITQRTTLSNGVVRNVQESEVETLIGLLREGRSVYTGTALFTPTVNLEGNFDVSVRVDKRILAALNARDAFTGEILNSSNIGKTSQELAEMWNEEYAEDPIDA
jgi:hypothetical protein